MADRLTANQLAQFARVNPRRTQILTASLDSSSIALTDITSRVTDWGSIKTEVYGKHPDETGEFSFPVLTVEVDNSDGAFFYGGALVPGGIDDFNSMTLRIENQIRANGDTAFTTFDDFTGRVVIPEYDDSKIVRLVAEHPLAWLARRKWLREDRIGGNTGFRGIL